MDFYVIKDSNQNSNYITVLKADFLTGEEVTRYYNDNDFTSIDGTIDYNKSEKCISADSRYCNVNYDISAVKRVVDGWVLDKFDENDLVNVDGYKSRLITIDEFVENLFYEIGSDDSGREKISASSNTPSVFIMSNNDSYWTMSPYQDSNGNIITAYKDRLESQSVFEGRKYYVRPVINLNKCTVEDCNHSDNVLDDDNDYNIYFEN